MPSTTATTTRPGVVVAVLAAGGIVASMMQTLVVPIVGELPQLLHSTAANTSWVIIVTLLVAAVATPAVGRLGDLYGKKRMLLLSVLPLVLGSVVCALSDSLVPMIVGRGLQGLGVGLIPLGISLLRDVMPAEKLGSSIALISASLGIGGALGLPVAAAVAEHSNWHVLFWGSAVLAAVVGVLVWALIPDAPTTATGTFDGVGAVGLGLGLVALLLGVSKGADWGWGSPTTVGLLVAAPVVLVVWGWWELRIDSPLVDLRVTARRQVLLTNAASVVLGFAMYAQSLITPQLLQLPTETGYGLGQSLQATGLWMAPAGLVMMALSPVGAKISAARGPRFTLALGAFVIALGYGSAQLLMGTPAGLLAVSCICSTGVAFAYGAMPALIMGAVPQSETASANSFNTLMRSVGTSVAAAVIGVVLSHMTIDLGGYAVPSEAGFRTGLLIGAGVAVVAGLVALTIPVRRALTGDAASGSSVSSGSSVAEDDAALAPA
ncbi:MFS transporter [Sediminihabitans luteus]|uniref:MFS transporter n=1 Tax=Sediminihabitans luteus TaxID=1138585 RepID=A0A2M9CCZ1_9CELL|nr:MFS transporter [Sediminihabitans luteus]PJJ69257.1 MFS transporter [Sediminihabitans luteus]GII98933.1 MFS transporter [Sediminihabitans luteus]